MNTWRNLTEAERLLIVIIIITGIVLTAIPVLGSILEVKVGDHLTTARQTPVYEYYQPGKLGPELCTLEEGQEVEIQQILTANDLPGNQNDGPFTSIIAFLIKAQSCGGWVTPDYLE